MTAEEATARDREPNQNGETKTRLMSASTGNGSSKERATPRAEPRRNRAPEGSGISITLNVEIPAGWTEEEIRHRIAAVSRALEPADAGDP